MSTFVAVNTYTHSVTYITAKMLHSLKFIIRESGLDPTKFVGDWELTERGIRAWLESQDLQSVVLEVFEPRYSGLVGRWDFDIVYGYGSHGDGAMWVDTDAIRHAIKKAGYWTNECEYRLVVVTTAGAPDVPGWSDTVLRSTDGFIRHGIGTTIGATGAGTATAYWRRS